MIEISITINGVRYDAVSYVGKGSCPEICDLYHMCDTELPGLSDFCNGLDLVDVCHVFKKSES